MLGSPTVGLGWGLFLSLTSWLVVNSVICSVVMFSLWQVRVLYVRFASSFLYAAVASQPMTIATKQKFYCIFLSLLFANYFLRLKDDYIPKLGTCNAVDGFVTSLISSGHESCKGWVLGRFVSFLTLEDLLQFIKWFYRHCNDSLSTVLLTYIFILEDDNTDLVGMILTAFVCCCCCCLWISLTLFPALTCGFPPSNNGVSFRTGGC